jgi:hypothetical protein
MTSDVLLPFPAARRELVPHATQVRGTWIAASLRAIRVRGKLESYLLHLPAPHRESVLASESGAWFPIDVLMAHYTACDALDFAPFELVKIGTEAVRHAIGPVLATMTKLAGAADPTPWLALSCSQRLWDRVFVGGGIAVTRLGARDARIDLVGFPGWRFRYCRIGMRGVLKGVIEMACGKAHVQEIESGPTFGAYRMSWA